VEGGAGGRLRSLCRVGGGEERDRKKREVVRIVIVGRLVCLRA
jgi:hypothetical protein